MATPGVPAPSPELLTAALARLEASPPEPLTPEQERTLHRVFDVLERTELGRRMAREHGAGPRIDVTPHAA